MSARNAGALRETTTHVVHPRRMRRLLTRHGGFTIDPRSGRRVASGISVCLNPHLSLRFPADAWSDESVARWLADRSLDLRRPGRFLGGWHDPDDQVWLDVVNVMPAFARRFAHHMALDAGQLSLFDLRRRALIHAEVGIG